MNRSGLLYVFFLLLSLSSFGQAIDNTSTFRNIGSEKYFRFSYDNDFFDATDNYYTQGFTFEYVAPGLKKFPLISILIRPKRSVLRFGLALEHEGYTASSILPHELLVGDRPYTACLFLKTFAIADDSSRQQRISSSLSTGVMGPWAIGGEMQTSIHRWLHNLLPQGWSHQLHNDVLLNYGITHEKKIIGYKDVFQLNSFEDLKFGTVNDKLALGLTAMLGNDVNPFSSKPQKHKFGIMLYEHPFINFIGYDATLLGGLFNRSSPYALPLGSINRITFQNMAGFSLRFNRLNVEYYQAYLSKEFIGGRIHKWGGIRLAMEF
jgi:lipid A 3-O-deacylase